MPAWVEMGDHQKNLLLDHGKWPGECASWTTRNDLSALEGGDLRQLGA
jgi:hypothetical protein